MMNDREHTISLVAAALHISGSPGLSAAPENFSSAPVEFTGTLPATDETPLGNPQKSANNADYSLKSLIFWSWHGL